MYRTADSGASWSQMQVVIPSSLGPTDAFGFAVALEDYVLIAGARLADDSSNSLSDQGVLHYAQLVPCSRLSKFSAHISF